MSFYFAAVLLLLMFVIALIHDSVVLRSIAADPSQVQRRVWFSHHQKIREALLSIGFLKHHSAPRESSLLEGKAEVSSDVLKSAAQALSLTIGGAPVWILLGASGGGSDQFDDLTSLLYERNSGYLLYGSSPFAHEVVTADWVSLRRLSEQGIELLIHEYFSTPVGEPGVILVGGQRTAPLTEAKQETIRGIAPRLGKELKVLSSMLALSSQVSSLERENSFARDVVRHVSHDLRSPLHTLKLVLSNLGVDKTNDADEMLNAGLRSCDVAQSVVDGLLDLTRPESEAGYEKSPCHLSELMKEVVVMLRPLAHLKGILLELRPSDDDELKADRGHIKRIFTNLISNAIKYTDTGSIFVEVRREGDVLVGVVSDSGSGMSPEQLSRLGEEGARFAPHKATGLGVGIFHTKTLVEKNNGSLSFSSELNVGTTAKVSFFEAIPQKEVIGG